MAHPNRKITADTANALMKRHAEWFSELPSHARESFDELAGSLATQRKNEISDDIAHVVAALELRTARRKEQETSEGMLSSSFRRHKLSPTDLDDLFKLYSEIDALHARTQRLRLCGPPKQPSPEGIRFLNRSQLSLVVHVGQGW